MADSTIFGDGVPDGAAPALTDYVPIGQSPSGETPSFVRQTLASIRNLFMGAPTAAGDFPVSIDDTGKYVKRTLAQTKTILGVDTLETKMNSLLGGLFLCPGTHTYASATTITVPAGALSIYSVGDKYKYTQARSQAYTNDPAAGSNIELNMTDTSGFNVGNIVTVSSSAGSEQARVTVVHANTHLTVDTLALNHTTTNPVVYIGKTTTGEKWAYITAVADELLTINSGVDYTLENATITTPYYSKGRAVGFPEWFNWDGVGGSNPTGFSAISSNVTKFSMEGKTVNLLIGFQGTSNAATMSLTAPIAASQAIDALCRALNNSATLSVSHIAVLASTTIDIYQGMSGGGWTGSNTKGVYPIVVQYKVG
jgi:hypothetical protein